MGKLAMFAKVKIAEAVVLPIPGNCSNVLYCFGKMPLYLDFIICAVLNIFSALR